MSRNTTEYCTLIKATSQLTRAVKNDLVQLSVELVANQLITVDKGEELRNRNVDVMERAAELVALVTNKVEQDKKNYYTFVRILMDHRSMYEEVLKDLEPVYSTGGHIYNKGASGALTISQPWYHRKLSRDDAEERLGEINGDSFLVRESTTQFGRLILSVKNGRTFYHFFIDRGVGTYEVEGTGLPFSSPVELIDYYTKYGLPENDTGEVILLKLPCNFIITPYSVSTRVSPQTEMKNTYNQCSSADDKKKSKKKGLLKSRPSSNVLLIRSLSGEQVVPEPLALLHQRMYFHGAISRIEAEALLDKEGQFLVRESSKQPGQYVLTGMAEGRPCHFLLTDEEGKVRSTDETNGEDVEFESIPHLVTYFTEKKIPLIHNSSRLILREPISVFSYRNS